MMAGSGIMREIILKKIMLNLLVLTGVLIGMFSCCILTGTFCSVSGTFELQQAEFRFICWKEDAAGKKPQLLRLWCCAVSAC